MQEQLDRARRDSGKSLLLVRLSGTVTVGDQPLRLGSRTCLMFEQGAMIEATPKATAKSLLAVADAELVLIASAGIAAGVIDGHDLAISGQEPRAVVQFSRDSGSFDPLTAVWGSYRPQAGENRWWVRQVDPAGNGSRPVSVSFTLDTATDRVSRLEGPKSATYEAVEGSMVSWTLQFDQPMEVAPLNGTLPALKFTFRGRDLLARYQEGSGTNRLTYAYTFTAADAGTGELTAPVTSCLCYGGTITDAAGNRHRKQTLPPVAG